MSNKNENVEFGNCSCDASRININNVNNDGTTNNRCDSLSEPEIYNEYKRDDCENNDNTDEKLVNINTFRYKFTDDFTKELYQFSKIHQYDERKDFKSAWNTWTEENIDLVNSEINRLTYLGYVGDILDKMFKSARYYFRKKSTEVKQPKTRREYIGVEKELLDAMDRHIMNNINNKNYKPADGFLEFCNDNIGVLKDEISRLCKSGINTTNDVKNKIKKTYKNRYFMFISNISK